MLLASSSSPLSLFPHWSVRLSGRGSWVRGLGSLSPSPSNIVFPSISWLTIASWEGDTLLVLIWRVTSSGVKGFIILGTVAGSGFVVLWQVSHSYIPQPCEFLVAVYYVTTICLAQYKEEQGVLAQRREDFCQIARMLTIVNTIGNYQMFYKFWF